MSPRIFPLLALAAIAPATRAYFLIDDFTVGEHRHTMGGFDNSWTLEQHNLDPEHSLFPDRATMVTIQQNQFHVPVQVDVASGGLLSVSTTNIVSSTLFNLYYDPTERGKNLSLGDSVWIDLFTEDPEQRIADSYDMSVYDATGRSDISRGWVAQPNGIKFAKSGFNPALDWSHVTLIQIRQGYSTNIGPPPLAYSIDTIYLVPEPGTLLGAGLLLFGLSPGRPRKRSA